MFSASKWLKHPVLLSEEEMREILSFSFSIHIVSDIVQEDELSKEDFLADYAAYIQGLKEGEVKSFRRTFSSVFTTSKDLLEKKEVKKDHFLIKPIKPVVQLQFHQFLASAADGKFYPMVASQESISWGIQFSYPQLFQDPETQKIMKVDDSFPNTSLFQQIVRQIKKLSVPATFVWKGEKTSTPIRIGKQCFEWIGRHPQLLSKGVAVHVY